MLNKVNSGFFFFNMQICQSVHMKGDTYAFFTTGNETPYITLKKSQIASLLLPENILPSEDKLLNLL